MNISVTCVKFPQPARTTDNLELKYKINIKKYSWLNVSKETNKHL